MNIKRMALTVGALVLAMMLTPVLVFTGGGTQQAATRVTRGPNARVYLLNQSEKMKIATLTGYTKSDSRTEKWMEQRYNIDIELIVLPGWSDSPAKISLLIADNTQCPDIMWKVSPSLQPNSPTAYL